MAIEKTMPNTVRCGDERAGNATQDTPENAMIQWTLNVCQWERFSCHITAQGYLAAAPPRTVAKTHQKQHLLDALSEQRQIFGKTQAAQLAVLAGWYLNSMACSWWATSLLCSTPNQLKIIMLQNKHNDPYPNYFLCPSFGCKHAKNSCSTSHIQNNFILEQVSVVKHRVSIRQRPNFILQHFL